MKRYAVKAIAILVISMFTLSLLAGCKKVNSNNDGSTQAAQQSSARDATTAKPAVQEPPTTLRVFIRDSYGITYDNLITHTIEEKTNTKLDIIAGAAADDQKLGIIIASGEIPDVFQGMNSADYTTYINNNILLPLNQYFDKMPGLKTSRSEETWKAMTEDDGNIYAIPIGETSGEYINMYRKDWLDKLGLQIPKTTEEYLAVADAVSNRDPDGNGVKDTFAFGSHKGMNGRQFAHIFGAFGVQYDNWMDVDGTLVYSNIQPQMKEALKFANKLYQIGALDPEFITDTSGRVKDKVVKGLYGAQCYKIYMFDEKNLNNYYEPFKQNVPGGKWVEGPLLAGPDGNSMKFQLLSARGWLKTAIYSKSKVLDASMRFVDYLASEEGQMLANYGIEGTHYTVENGVVKSKVDDVAAKEAGVVQWAEYGGNLLYRHTSEEYQRLSKLVYEMSLPNRPIDAIEGRPEAAVKYEKQLLEWLKTQFVVMIVGETPIDGGFEKLVEEWNTRGGKEITEAYNKMYKERKG